jgi:hypothetical protein
MVATIVLLVLLVLDLGINLGKHGEPKSGEYNFWITLLSVAIMLYLYYKAGLFNNFNI